ncbi:MAG: sigma-E processing peptidase SpoIIGA [Clostridia bacterium]|nr:sigma-E processing peptidase SpoIIGA [Clostridia bacterium]
MTVYIEYVILDNFFIDFMLFKTAFKVTGKSMSRRRTVVCAAAGAIFALVYPLVTDNAVVISVVKVLFGLFLTFIAAKFSSVKDYAAFTAVFFGLTFFIGGAISGFYSLLGISAYSEFSVALTVLPVYLAMKAAIRLVRFFYRKKDISGLVVKAEIFCGERSVVLRGFFDTGNSLYDDLTPVIIVTKSAILPVLDVDLLKGAKQVTVETAVGKERKFSFKPDMLVIYSGGNKNIFNNVRVCVVNKVFSDYDAILHPAFMENGYERKIVV